MDFTRLQTLNILGPVLLLAVALVILIIRLVRQNSKEKPKDLVIRKDKRHSERRRQNVYIFLSKVPFISIFLENIRARLYAAHYLDEPSLRSKTINTILKAGAFAVVVFIAAFFLFDRTFYNTILLVLISGIVFSTFLNNFIGDDDILLEQLPEAVADLKHYFSSEKTIEKAYMETMKVVPYEVGLHFQKILTIIQLPYEDGKAELRRYYEECPDRYLKILASYSFITSEYGDVRSGTNEITKGDSLFNKNMNHLISEIRNEYRKRRNVKMSLIGQKVFVMAPIFALPILKKYVMTFMKLPALEDFYTSSPGYIDMIVCTAVSVFCYIVYNGIVKTNRNEHKISLTIRAWEDIFLKYKIIRAIVYRLMPRKNSSGYMKIIKQMNESGSQQKMEWVYLRKIIIAILTFVLLFSVIEVVHFISVNSIYNDLAYGVKDKIVYQNILDMNTGRSEKEVLETDRRILEKIRNLDQFDKLGENEIKTYITRLLEKENVKPADTIQMNADRIYKKFIGLKGASASIFEIMLIVFVSWLSYFVPNLRLSFNVRVQRLSMLDEVISYQTVILLLIYHKKATPEMVLEWLVWFSDIFYKPLNEAKNNYNDKKIGGVKALRKLQEEVNYKQLRQIIQNLTLAEEKLPLIDAFAELEQDQKFSSETRKDNTEIIIQTKVALASRIASLSTGFTLIFYLVVPIVYSIVMMLSDMMKTITLY